MILTQTDLLNSGVEAQQAIQPQQLDSMQTQDVVVEDVFDEVPGVNQMNNSEKRRTFDTIGDVSAANSSQSKAEPQAESLGGTGQTPTHELSPIDIPHSGLKRDVESQPTPVLPKKESDLTMSENIPDENGSPRFPSTYQQAQPSMIPPE